MSQFFASGGQRIGVSASASDLPMNIRGWFPLRLTGLISLLSKGLSRVFSSTTVQKYQFFGTQPSLWSNSHIHTWLWKNHSFDYTDYTKWCLLIFNMLSRFVIAFLSRMKSPSTVILEPKKMSLFPLVPHLFARSDGTRCHDISFLNVEL